MTVMALYAFDGSWRDADKDSVPEWTNVSHIHNLYEQSDACSNYWDGVGTRYGFVGKYVGGAIGVGVHHRVKEAQIALYNAFSAGDETIDIVGFSRGAAAATAFAWSIYRSGVRVPRNRKKYLQSNEITFANEVIQSSPSIRFVGLFDTVFSTVALQEFLPFREHLITQEGRFMKFLLRRDFRLPENVESAFHAMAMHEKRAFFPITRIENAYEVWFAGDHGDIGGGDKERRVTDTSLKWMLSKAIGAGVGIPSDITPLEGGSIPDTIREDHGQLPRSIRSSDRVYENTKTLQQISARHDLLVEH